MSTVSKSAFSSATELLGGYHLVVPVGIMCILMIMVMPLPAIILDLLISMNITLSIIIVMVSMYIRQPVQFSVFPSLLLIITLFRLALNIASTRLILLQGAGSEDAAGKVIQAFGQFVVGGNYFVGIVVFLVLMVIQYVVINHGAVRISEVTARFTLDAMPGKQMSVDADLNAGLINEAEARKRREEVTNEAEFYGSMDGAIRFTSRDAVASMVILAINIIGGFLIGVVQFDMELMEAAQRFTILTIGDGLVTAIPSLLISVAGGIITTRAASDSNLGDDVVQQLFTNPTPIAIGSCFMFFFGLIPGLPFLPFFVMGCLTAVAAWRRRQSSKAEQQLVLTREQAERADAEKPREKIEGLLKVDMLAIEMGYGLIRYVDASQGGDFLERIKSIRRQMALEMGLIVPPVHITDNLQLNPRQYAILLKGVQVARGELVQDHLLAINPGTAKEEIHGVPTVEPAFGLEARWIKSQEREKAQMAGYTLVDPATVLATHLTEIIKSHACELLGRQEVQSLLDNVAQTHPKIVEDLVPKILSIGDVQKVLQNLLKERVSVRDVVTILETLADQGSYTKNIVFLTEQCRQALGRSICKPYQNAEGELPVFTVSPDLEKNIADGVVHADQGAYLALEPRQARDIMNRFRQVLESAGTADNPVVLCSANVRMYVRQLLERFLPSAAILSHNEIPPNVRVLSLGMVN
ncbi:MAG: flagellar biosynthesis protein FlhA [Acidobacteriota bacterium]|jgi:flagellar biosynthesis protein FlhA|nr:flagellar biosynthesis protein FlhA [Acidobacteriota bacterium]